MNPQAPAALPTVELLWWAGCPSHEKAQQMLEAALAKAGLTPSLIKRLQVVTPGDAAREHFIGSPTIRINGQDIVPPPPDELPALTCRLYIKSNGRPSPLPEQELIDRAVATAAQA